MLSTSNIFSQTIPYTLRNLLAPLGKQIKMNITVSRVLKCFIIFGT